MSVHVAPSRAPGKPAPHRVELGRHAAPTQALQGLAGNRATGTLLLRKPHAKHASDKVDLKTAETVMSWILRIINELYADDPSKLPAEAVPSRYKELLSLWHELTYGKLEGEEFLSRYARASALTEPLYLAVVRGGGGQWRQLLSERWFDKHGEFERRKDEQTHILALLKDADPLFWLHYEPTPVSLGEFLETATRQNSREVPLQRPGGLQVGTAKAGITYYASQQEPRLLLWACPSGVFFSIGDQIYMQSLDGFSEDIIIGAVIKAAQDVAPFVELMTVVVDIAISLTPVGALYDLTMASKAAAEGNWKEAALNLLPHVPLGRLAKLTRVGRIAFRAGSKGVEAIERAVAGAATFAGRGLRKIAGKLKRGLWIVTEGASEMGGKKAYYFLDEAEQVWKAVPEEEAAAFIHCSHCELTSAGKGEAGAAGEVAAESASDTIAKLLKIDKTKPGALKELAGKVHALRGELAGQTIAIVELKVGGTVRYVAATNAGAWGGWATAQRNALSKLGIETIEPIGTELIHAEPHVLRYVQELGGKSNVQVLRWGMSAGPKGSHICWACRTIIKDLGGLIEEFRWQ